MVWANRNGNFYVLDRETGKFLVGKPFVKVNWMDTFDERGRPHPDAAAGRAADVARQSGRHELVLAVLQPAHGAVLRVGLGGLRDDLRRDAVEYQEGRNFGGGANRPFVPVPARPPCPACGAARSTTGPKPAATGAVLALDADQRAS